MGDALWLPHAWGTSLATCVPEALVAESATTGPRGQHRIRAPQIGDYYCSDDDNDDDDFDYIL